MRMRARWLALGLLLAVAAEAQVRYRKLPPETIEQRLASAPDQQGARGEMLRRQFLAAGCAPENLKDDAVAHLKFPNILCVVPGKTGRLIIVGAHYDYVSAGRGIADNWSGAALLPSLLESLHNEPREHTFLFIAFTGEEEGLLGSKSYVSHLSKEQRKAISAMVNIDTLGLSPTKVWESDSSKALVTALRNAAWALHSPLAIVDVENVGRSDNDSFRKAKVPEICIHSITQATLHVLHSRDDQLTAIHPEDYYETYRLLTAYLALLDRDLDLAPAEADPGPAVSPKQE